MTEQATATRRGQVRYSPKLILEARLMAEGGWEPGEIRRVLNERHGLNLVFETVRGWVDEEFAAQRRATFARAKRKRRRERGVTWLPRGANVDTKLHRMEVLRSEAHLSFRAIAEVMNLDYGLDLTPHEVRHAMLNDVVPLKLRSAA